MSAIWVGALFTYLSLLNDRNDEKQLYLYRMFLKAESEVDVNLCDLQKCKAITSTYLYLYQSSTLLLEDTYFFEVVVSTEF